MSKPKGPGKSGSADEAASRPAAGQDSFDTWLRRRLKDSFDSVASEPVPEHLLDILRKAATKRKRS